MPNLFPVFDIPQMTPTSNLKTVNQNVESFYFDFELGDFRVDGAGKGIIATPVETWKQWCLKAVATERYRFRAYSKQYGGEWERLGDYASKKAKESWIERTVTETLLADPLKRTAYVKNFTYVWDTDSANVGFTIFGQDGMSATLHVQI